MRLGIPSVTGTALGIGRETWAVGAAMASYRKRFAAPVRPRNTRATWATEPVVLVHGLGHNNGAWLTLGARLGAAGFFDLAPVTYGVDDKVPWIAGRIADEVEAMLVSRSVERVHLIGHSLGGVAVRYWHDMLGGYALADAVVTLGTPHRGTIWTHLPFVSAPVRDLARGSTVTERMGAQGVRHDRWTTIGGTFDVVVPPSRAHLPGAEHVNVAAGHAGLLTSAAAAGHVCMALLHMEEQRATASAESRGSSTPILSPATGDGDPSSARCFTIDAATEREKAPADAGALQTAQRR